jgi:DNA-3-methyladenine glycosylase I
VVFFLRGKICGVKRTKRDCGWPGEDALMRAYHDTEWGTPVYDDRKIFEFLVLESMQAGLSWKTILHKRKNFKKAFLNFDYKKVAAFTKSDVNRLLKDAGIIRNRLKIEAAIENAKQFIKIRKEFRTFSKYMWSFVQGKPIQGKRKRMGDIPAVTKEAEIFAKDLKKRGFRFLGPTVIYAHMQAVGMVNDHITTCTQYKRLARSTL